MPAFTLTASDAAELRKLALDIDAWDEELERRQKSVAAAKVGVDLARLEYLSAMSVLAKVAAGREQAIERRNEKLKSLRVGGVAATASPPDGEGSDTD